MNRSELIEAVAADTGLSKAESEAAIAAIVYEITKNVKSGQPMRITGFGSFKLRERAARKGRNPQTGASVKVKASKGIGFTPGVKLKADLNARGAVAKPGAAKAASKAAAPAKANTPRVSAARVGAAKTKVAKAAAPVAGRPAKLVSAAAAPTKRVPAKAAPAKKASTRR